MDIDNEIIPDMLIPENSVPFVGLYDQLSSAMSSMTISGFRSVDHEDKELNSDFSVDPLADPRLDKMDLYAMSDSQTRDAIMNTSESFAVSDSDPASVPASDTTVTPSSASGPGE